jgi:hypothetical protein
MLKIRTSKPPPTNRKSISPQSRDTQDSYKYTWEKIRMIWTCILHTQSVQQSYGAPFWIHLQGWKFWDPFRTTSQFLASAYPNAFCAMPHFSDPAPKKICKHWEIDAGCEFRWYYAQNSNDKLVLQLLSRSCSSPQNLQHNCFKPFCNSLSKVPKKTIRMGPSFCLM